MHDVRRPRIFEDRFPDYDVLSKRWGPSWNEQTRQVIARRLSIGAKPRFFTDQEFATVIALAARIVPQPATRPNIPVAGLVDDKLLRGKSEGYREVGLPREPEAWRLGLKALEAEAKNAFATSFSKLAAADQDALLTRMEKGELRDPAWQGMPPAVFFRRRMALDMILAYYSYPTAWNEIGWGGPASPRGYVRMDYDERDPWEAVEVKNGDVAAAQRQNRRVR
jgi:hypothetical protein